MHAESERRHNKDERHSSLEKYTFHFIWKGCVWEGVGDRTEQQHVDPHSISHNSVSFPFSWAAQPEAKGPTLLGAGFFYRILSPTGLISNWLNFLCTELYNCSMSTFFLWASQIALIQPVHGQGYILIFLYRTHLLFTLAHFLFWQTDRVGGQYTTLPHPNLWIWLKVVRRFLTPNWHKLVCYLVSCIGSRNNLEAWKRGPRNLLFSCLFASQFGMHVFF